MVNTYFLDSSALVKRYVPETGSSWIQSITDPNTGNSIAIARIAWVEALSAFARRQCEGNLSTDELDIMVQKFRNDFTAQYQIIEVDPALIEKAGELVIQYPLRAYDAIQLASALRLQSNLAFTTNTQFIFVTADVRLINIAQSESLVSDNPNNYP